MIKRKRKRNPRLQGIAKEILSEVDDWEYLAEGGFGEVYYFIIDSSLHINDVELNSGEYVLKIEFDQLFEDEIMHLKKLSSLKLIPKIYYIDNQITIMKYIEGKTLRHYVKLANKEQIKTILLNIKKMINYWHKLGFAHGDLKNPDNIIVNDQLNIFFIDPILSSIKNFFEVDLCSLDNYKTRLLKGRKL